MSCKRVVLVTNGLLLIFALALSSFDVLAQQLRQRLVRVGDIAFGTSFADAREAADTLVGIGYTTGDRRVLKTLAQTRVAMFGTTFNLTYVFGTDDRLTRVFGSMVRAMDLDKKTCLVNGADVLAASVRLYGSPDIDRSGNDWREWRFNFADGRWIRFKYYFGGVMNGCNIILNSVTPEGQNDHT